ncbi:phospholipase A [Desulfuromonas sp. TF]|uniref:phospholipase A n=1 Tax=Desulfuromonas sp. TF TaxID=1232410 RepID=UPI00041ED530|nr:phospholipase A [Desulfuromonas sp. TF]
MIRSLFIASLALLILLPPAAFADPLNSPRPAAGSGEESQSTSDKGILGRIGRGFSMHKENYILPLTWGNTARDAEDAEVKFQLSFKQHFGRDFFLAYTQKSFWRILDKEDSRPFRVTDHNPQVFYRLPQRSPPWGVWGADLGYEHESNGAREPTSRSWDRLYITPFVEYSRLRTELKLWHRISEEIKEDPLDPAGDENPDIEEFYGYGELRLSYETLRRHLASMMLRWNFATDKGGLQLDYSIPTRIENLFFHAQLWTGYGESLIDYNRSLTRYGVGLQFRQ